MRTPVNCTTTYGLARLMEMVQQEKHKADVEDDYRPKTTRSVYMRVALTRALLEDNDTEEILKALRKQARSKNAEVREEAQLILKHWQMAQDELDTYDLRHG